MKNILIILGMTLVFGIASMFITEAFLRKADMKKDLKQEVAAESETSVQNAMDAFAQSSKELAEQVRLTHERESKSRLAGSIGAGIGFISSLTIVFLRDRKNVKN